MTSFESAVKSNNHEEIKDLLRRDDGRAFLQLDTEKGRSPLQQICLWVGGEDGTVKIETVQLIIDELRNRDDDNGSDMLERQLVKENSSRMNGLCTVCHQARSAEVIDLFLKTLLELGGKMLLRKQYVETVEDDIPCWWLAANTRSATFETEYVQFLVGLAVEFGLFEKQYRYLNSDLKRWFTDSCDAIKSEDWVPEGAVLARVKSFLAPFSDPMSDDFNAILLAIPEGHREVEAVKKILHPADDDDDSANRIKKLLSMNGAKNSKTGHTLLMETLSSGSRQGEWPGKPVAELLLQEIRSFGGDYFREQLLMKEKDGSTVLMMACQYLKNHDDFHVILDAIKEAATSVSSSANSLNNNNNNNNNNSNNNVDFLKELVMATNDEGRSCLNFAYLYASDKKKIASLIELILQIGRGGDCLRSLLENKVTITNNNNDSSCVLRDAILSGYEDYRRASFKLLVHFLAEFRLFHSQCALLSDRNCDTFKKFLDIDYDEWAPDFAFLEFRVRTPILEASGGGEAGAVVSSSSSRGGVRGSSHQEDDSSSNNSVNIKQSTLKNFFEKYDLDNTGLIDKSAMCAAIVMMFPCLSSTTVAERVRKAEPRKKENGDDNNNKLDFEDFCAILGDVL